MIELLVAVTILILMLMAFSMILTQSQKVVSVSQRNMRANAAAGAIGQVFRGDLRRATQQGMLCITQTFEDGPPRLVFTTAGITPSKTHAEIGTGGLVCFGLSANYAGPYPTLYYQRWVLKFFLSGGPSPPTDVLSAFDLASLQAWDRGEMNNCVDQVCAADPNSAGYEPGSSIQIPPRTIEDVGALWQVMGARCEWISIMWTDGTIFDNNTPGNLSDDEMNWYGVRYDTSSGYIAQGRGFAPTYAPDPTSWINQPFDESDLSQIEFDVGPGGTDVYRALWTQHNQNNWPKAIRIRFRLSGNPNDPADKGAEYEVICPVGG